MFRSGIIGVVTRVWVGILVLGAWFLQGQKLLLSPADSQQLRSQLSLLSNALFPQASTSQGVKLIINPIQVLMFRFIAGYLIKHTENFMFLIRNDGYFFWFMSSQKQISLMLCKYSNLV